MSLKIVFFGSGPVAAKSLEFLAANLNIEAVITKTKPQHHKEEPPVENVAKKLGLKILFANTKDEISNVIDEQNFESRLGVVVDYGVIIPQKVIDSFELGIMNSHFSLLPQWRGADPITFALLSGQKKTGISLMLIEPEVDTGKLLTRKSLEIDPNDNVMTLTERLVNFSNQLMIEYIPRYINSEIKPKRQPHPDRATYSRKISKSDGLIDWSKSAEQIEREVRAYYGWPGSQTEIGNKRIIIKKAHVSKTKEDLLDFKAGDGKYLSIDELIAPSGRKMTAIEFINGYKYLLT